MHLVHVSLPVADPVAVARWYAETLALPTRVVGGTWQVTIGTTELSLHPGVATGAHHLAFDVAPEGFADARRRLEARAPLVELAGEAEFAGPAGWRSTSVYVAGPEGSVLELIARRDLPVPDPGPAGRLLRVSEVGMAVADVRATASELRTQRDVPAYAAEPEADFAAVGDVHGLLVLVADGRRWYPTADRYAAPAAITVTATGPRPGRTQVGAGTLVVT